MTGSLTLLDHVARGVQALSEGAGSSIPPYPDETQYALDLVVQACLRSGYGPPAGVPELIRWCTDLAAPSWPFPPGVRYDGLALVDPVHRTRTRACAELVGLAAVAETLSDGAAARGFLRSHVLLGPDTQRELLMKDPKAASVLRFVKELYRPVPAEWTVRDRIALCECGLPARPDEPDYELVAWCERETCPPGTRVKQSLPAARARLLHPALRLFAALPAQGEDRLRRELGVTDQDAVRFADGKARTFRYYDRVVAVALARDAMTDGVDIAVVPDGSALDGPTARRVFTAALPPGTEITLMSESELLEEATSTGRTPDA